MGMMDSMDIGAKGLEVHGKRLDIHARNIANIDTPNYVRKIPMISSPDGSSFQEILSSSGSNVLSGSCSNAPVEFDGIMEDPTLGDKVYRPGHPDADKDGYIRLSNVNPMVDMADAMLAQRAYEANLSIISISKTMALKATEIGK